MVKKVLSVVFVVMILMSSAVFAQDRWLPLPDTDTHWYTFDTVTAREFRENGYTFIEVWIARSPKFVDDDVRAGVHLAHLHMLFCTTTNQHIPRESMLYGPKNNFLQRIEYPNAKWQSIVPGSMAEGIVGKVYAHIHSRDNL